jgi:hypothetical protein
VRVLKTEHRKSYSAWELHHTCNLGRWRLARIRRVRQRNNSGIEDSIVQKTPGLRDQANQGFPTKNKKTKTKNKKQTKNTLTEGAGCGDLLWSSNFGYADVRAGERRRGLLEFERACGAGAN